MEYVFQQSSPMSLFLKDTIVPKVLPELIWYIMHLMEWSHSQTDVRICLIYSVKTESLTLLWKIIQISIPAKPGMSIWDNFGWKTDSLSLTIKNIIHMRSTCRIVKRILQRIWLTTTSIPEDRFELCDIPPICTTTKQIEEIMTIYHQLQKKKGNWLYHYIERVLFQ